MRVQRFCFSDQKEEKMIDAGDFVRAMGIREGRMTPIVYMWLFIDREHH